MHIARQFGFSSQEAISNHAILEWSEISLETLRLQNLFYHWLGSLFVSYAMYFGIGGFLHVGIKNKLTLKLLKYSFIVVNTFIWYVLVNTLTVCLIWSKPRWLAALLTNVHKFYSKIYVIAINYRLKLIMKTN